VMKTSDAQWAPWSDDPDGRLTGRGDGRISLCARIRALRGVCEPIRAPRYSNPVSGAVSGEVAGAANGNATGAPVGALIGGAVGTATGTIAGTANMLMGR
jgi:uncharacterized membrane protein